MFELYARIVEAEAGALDYAGKLGVAQCIIDLNGDIKAFTAPAGYYTAESYRAVQDAFSGKRRLQDKILQFRSWKKYGPNGTPDWEKLGRDPYLAGLDYLGKDGSGEWGHYYFGTKEDKMFKLLLIAGHGDGDPGAIGCGYHEADLTRELAQLVYEAAREKGIDVDLADTSRNHYKYLKDHGMDFTPYSYVFEIHFNASAKTDYDGDHKVTGSMIYISQSETGHSVEDAILRQLYGIGSRQAWDGVVVAQRQWPAGLLVQERVRAQGVSHAVLETCFISDKDDMIWYQGHKRDIAQAIVTGISIGFGLKEGENRSYCGQGIATAEALDSMNVRTAATVSAPSCGVVYTGQCVEVLEKLPSGWLKIVWPGAAAGYAYTSNVAGKYYKYK